MADTAEVPYLVVKAQWEEFHRKEKEARQKELEEEQKKLTEEITEVRKVLLKDCVDVEEDNAKKREAKMKKVNDWDWKRIGIISWGVVVCAFLALLIIISYNSCSKKNTPAPEPSWSDDAKATPPATKRAVLEKGVWVYNTTPKGSGYTVVVMEIKGKYHDLHLKDNSISDKWTVHSKKRQAFNTKDFIGAEFQARMYNSSGKVVYQTDVIDFTENGEVFWIFSSEKAEVSKVSPE